MMGVHHASAPRTAHYHPQYTLWESYIQDIKAHWKKNKQPIIPVDAFNANHSQFLVVVQALRNLHFLPPQKEADDPAVQQALKTLQSVVGLPATGQLNQETADVLNGKNPRLIHTMEHTQKEWKTLGPLPQRYILCNIPAFTLDLMDQGKSIVHSRIMVGKLDSRTPIFSGFIYSIVFNPTWILPPSQYKTYMPYVGQEGYYVKNGRLMQKPGPKNHLGQVKFLTGRSDMILLHSTHEPELFAHPVRAYSLGCLRVEQYQDLAEKILSVEKSTLSIPNILENKIQKTVVLKQPVPVLAVYCRLWIKNNRIQFFPDIYGHHSGGKTGASWNRSHGFGVAFSNTKKKNSKKTKSLTCKKEYPWNNSKTL